MLGAAGGVVKMDQCKIVDVASQSGGCGQDGSVEDSECGQDGSQGSGHGQCKTVGVVSAWKWVWSV